MQARRDRPADLWSTTRICPRRPVRRLARARPELPLARAAPHAGEGHLARRRFDASRARASAAARARSSRTAARAAAHEAARIAVLAARGSGARAAPSRSTIRRSAVPHRPRKAPPIVALVPSASLWRSRATPWGSSSATWSAAGSGRAIDLFVGSRSVRSSFDVDPRAVEFSSASCRRCRCHADVVTMTLAAASSSRARTGSSTLEPCRAWVVVSFSSSAYGGGRAR